MGGGRPPASHVLLPW